MGGSACLRNDFDDGKTGLRKSGCTSAFNLHQRVTQQQKDLLSAQGSDTVKYKRRCCEV